MLHVERLAERASEPTVIQWECPDEEQGGGWPEAIVAWILFLALLYLVARFA